MARPLLLVATCPLLLACSDRAPAPSPLPPTASVAIEGARLEPGGLRLERAGGSLATTAIGRAGAPRTLSKATPTRRDGRAILDRDGVREWWVGGARGLELGYDLARRPDGEGELAVTLTLDHGTRPVTVRVPSDGVAAFVFVDQALWLTFSELAAKDASGRVLPSRFRAAGPRLELVIDDRGALYPIAIDPIVSSGTETKLSADVSGGAGFGQAIAMTTDKLAIKEAQPIPGGSEAAVVLYRRSASDWSPSGRVTLPVSSGGTDSFGAFGDALGFATDGSVLVGDIRFSYGSSTWAGGVFGYAFSTSAYTALLKPASAAADDQFGFAIGASSNSVIVGARSTSGAAGAAYVFSPAAGTVYTQQAKLTPPSATEYFGWDVATDGDLAAVGCISDKAYSYRRTGTSWSYDATLVGSDTLSGDAFGQRLALAGSTLLVGAPGKLVGTDPSGQAYVFVAGGTGFTEQAKLFTAPPVAGQAGTAVALSADGNTAFVGAPAAAGGQGRVFAFKRTGTTWSLVRTIAPSDASSTNFGRSLAVSGARLAVSSPPSFVYVYDPALGLALGGACVASTDCAAGACVDGVCCATSCTGQCEACNLKGKEGTCSPVSGAPVGARTACGGTGPCASTCDGTTTTACTAPGVTTTCGAASCDGSGRAVPVGHCDGSGACTASSPVPCGTYACVGGACAAKCTTDADCATDARCDATGACVGKSTVGGKCAAGSECSSGFCVDGACCDRACAGQCEACDRPSAPGTCGAVTGAPHGARIACPKPTCSLGVATTAACGASGACEVTTASCAPYACDGTGCAASCTSDTDCATGTSCRSGACLPPVTDAGAPAIAGGLRLCTVDSECATGHCSDGVCCDRACKEKCHSCVVPGLVGTCTAEPGLDLRKECDAARCSTTCGSGACRPIRAGDQCAPSVCTGPSTLKGPSTCSGAGASCDTAAAVYECAPYACALGACLSSCGKSDECAAGFACDTATGRCETQVAATDGGCAIEQVGLPGAPAWLGLAVLALTRARRRTASRPRGLGP
ncbi:MAG: hypothetical protein IPJ34_02900 [Myxococcales bacterium]|nr:hypothetical protein [Myxococcales bacterium]